MKKLLNLPNILTILRMLMIPVFAKMYYSDQQAASMLVFLLASATDLLDGYLARKWNQVTDFGALMDPLADKIFVTTIMLILVEYQLIAAWVAAVVICREFMVTGLRLLAVKQGKVISADKFGKLKTVLQMIMLFVGGLVWIHILDLNMVIYKSIKLGHLWHTLLWGIVIVTVGSGLNYFIKNRELIADKSKK